MVYLQELILEKVREDMMVRTKISQSSALRQKRGQTAANQRADSTETEAPLGLNNNGLYSQAEKKGLIHANGTTGEPERIFNKVEELKITNTYSKEEEEEEESVSTDSLSEISKFESEFLYNRTNLSLNTVIAYKDLILFSSLCVSSSSQS